MVGAPSPAIKRTFEKDQLATSLTLTAIDCDPISLADPKLMAAIFKDRKHAVALLPTVRSPDSGARLPPVSHPGGNSSTGRWKESNSNAVEGT